MPVERLSVADLYTDLVHQFRQAHAEFGESGFCVHLCTDEQRSWAEGHGMKRVATLGLASKSPLHAYAPVVRGWPSYDANDKRALTRYVNVVRRVGEPRPEPFNRLRKLARLAGSHLPRKVRVTLPDLPPASQFLVLMRKLAPPVEVPSDQADVFQAFWHFPFQAGGDTVELLKIQGPPAGGTQPGSANDRKSNSGRPVGDKTKSLHIWFAKNPDFMKDTSRYGFWDDLVKNIPREYRPTSKDALAKAYQRFLMSQTSDQSRT